MREAVERLWPESEWIQNPELRRCILKLVEEVSAE